MITEEAYAKINLSLDITGKRANGYHDVRMVMQSIDLHDTLSFEAKETGISLVTDNEELNRESESGKDNLIVKAAKALFAYTGCERGVKISLTKRIPIAAGMAGGSTDAAATLRGLNRLFSFGLDVETLKEIGVKLGADIPFCIEGGTQLAEGIGEKLTKLRTPDRTLLVICKPNINVSTKEVYERYDALTNVKHPDVDAQLACVAGNDCEGVYKNMGNVLAYVTEGLYPIISDIKATMCENGAEYAMMSGSGPTVFGIVHDTKTQDNLVTKLKTMYGDAYVGGHFYG